MRHEEQGGAGRELRQVAIDHATQAHARAVGDHFAGDLEQGEGVVVEGKQARPGATVLVRFGRRGGQVGVVLRRAGTGDLVVTKYSRVGKRWTGEVVVPPEAILRVGELHPGAVVTPRLASVPFLGVSDREPRQLRGKPHVRAGLGQAQLAGEAAFLALHPSREQAVHS